jgi:hypothetical protein
MRGAVISSQALAVAVAVAVDPSRANSRHAVKLRGTRLQARSGARLGLKWGDLGSFIVVTPF